MRKWLIPLIVMAALFFTGCNKQLVDFNYYFNRAIVKLPDGKVIEGAPDNWRDYEDGDQIQVTIDGVTYLVHSSNIALIFE